MNKSKAKIQWFPPKEWGFFTRGLVFLGWIAILGAITVLGENIVNMISGDQENQENEETVLLFEDLVHKVEVESLRGTEYFNSPTYSSLVDSGRVGRGPADSDSVYADKLKKQKKRIADKLKKRIKEPNRKYLLSLLALRAVSDPNVDSVYVKLDTKLKIRILTDALNQAKFFNGWGVPDLYRRDPNSARQLEEPVEAIIELGRPAIPVLKKLLSEKRNAPFWGSDESAKHDYQVADYALALIVEIEFATGIRDVEFTFPKERGERDSLIKEYIEKYGIKRM